MYLTLTQSEDAGTEHIPVQFDRDDRIRRASTVKNLKRVIDSNPYKGSMQEQVIFFTVAISYSIFGWYPVFLGREELSAGETAICAVLSFGCACGMHGCYYINVHRNIVAYSKSLRR